MTCLIVDLGDVFAEFSLGELSGMVMDLGVALLFRTRDWLNLRCLFGPICVVFIGCAYALAAP